MIKNIKTEEKYLHFPYYQAKKIYFDLLARRYKKLAIKIRKGDKPNKKKIETTINNYFKTFNNIWLNVNSFPYLDDCLFEPENKETSSIFYSIVLRNILRIKKEIGSSSLTLEMFNILVGAKSLHRHTLLSFLKNQKQYEYTKKELLILDTIDEVRKSITDSYSLETGIKRDKK